MMPVQKGFPVAEDTDVVEVMEDTVVEVVEIEDVATHDQIILDLSVEINDVPKSEVCSEPEAMTDFPKSEFPFRVTQYIIRASAVQALPDPHRSNGSWLLDERQGCGRQDRL